MLVLGCLSTKQPSFWYSMLHLPGRKGNTELFWSIVLYLTNTRSYIVMHKFAHKAGGYPSNTTYEG